MQHPTTQLKELVRCTASENVTEHGPIEAVEEIALDSTEAACLSDHELLDWEEYRRIRL